jgi:hypothetical protein
MRTSSTFTRHAMMVLALVYLGCNSDPLAVQDGGRDTRANSGTGGRTGTGGSVGTGGRAGAGGALGTGGFAIRDAAPSIPDGFSIPDRFTIPDGFTFPDVSFNALADALSGLPSCSSAVASGATCNAGTDNPCVPSGRNLCLCLNSTWTCY